jgi:hypothetical protein
VNQYLGIICLAGLVGVASFYRSGGDYKRSVNPCPQERNIGQYGPAARYDGILITGSPEFVSRTITALNRLRGTKSYHFARWLRHIDERELSPNVLAQVSRRYAEVAPRTARLSCTIYAGIIVHEGAHVVYGSGHGPVYAAQSRALQEMGEPYAARAALVRAASF